jgi:hypothetical protein
MGGARRKHIRHEKNTKIHFGRTEGKYHFDRLDINGREILKWTVKTHSGKGNPLFIWLTIKTIHGLE